MFSIVSNSSGWIRNEVGDVLVLDTDTEDELWIPVNTISFDQSNNPLFKSTDGRLVAGGYCRVEETPAETPAVITVTDHQNASMEPDYHEETSAFDTQTMNNNDVNVSDQNNTKRNYWSYDATLALITAVESRDDDMFHINKKKTFWAIVAEELCSLSMNFPEKVCAKKWENLSKTYKNSKDNKKKTGRGPTRFPFFDRLDELLGDSPTNASPHSIDVNMEIDSILHEPVVTPSGTPDPDRPYDEQSTSEGNNKKRKNPSMEYVKIKKNYYEKKERDRIERDTRFDKYLEQSMQLKIDRRADTKKRLDLEERKVVALERIAQGQ